MTIDVKFNDSGRKATQPANPKFPKGVDVSCADSGVPTCTRNLPYPAPGVGTYSVICRECGFTALVTVAGRADDPRSITIPCKGDQHENGR
jgi:hypothetical protein